MLKCPNLFFYIEGLAPFSSHFLPSTSLLFVECNGIANSFELIIKFSQYSVLLDVILLEFLEYLTTLSQGIQYSLICKGVVDINI